MDAAGLPVAAWVTAGAVLGSIAGSFLALLTWRWPQGLGIGGRSRCDDCGVVLGPLALVPIVSFVAQRGRCRQCGAAIAPRHLAIEMAAATIGAALLWRWPGGEGLALALAGWWLLALIVLDAEHQWLPDALTLPLIPVALLLPGPPPLPERLWGAGLGFAGLWLVGAVYRRLRGHDGLGGGDPKLLAGLGAMLGAWALPLLISAAAGVGLGLAGWDALRGRSVTGMTRLPFGALLAGVALIGLWIGPGWREYLQ
jgi:leader peptidase (prepilin peptidase)/N-methyltransferase